MRLDEPALVEREYADDELLRRRAAVFTGRAAGVDVQAIVVEEVAGAARVLEVGCGPGEDNLEARMRRRVAIFVATR